MWVRAMAMAVGLAALGVPPGTAHAIAPCPGADTKVVPVLEGQGLLESAIVDARGRLFYTDTALKALRRLDAPGAQPVTVADGIDAPGGLAIDDRGRILVGQGDGIVPGLIGNVAPQARLLRVGPDGGPVETVATGLQMVNGVVRADDGTVFASTDVGFGIDRIAPDGKVTVRWASIYSANGLAIDRAQKWLYAAQTFRPAQISRISLADPSIVEPFATPSPDGIAGGPDGMTIDGRDRLYVAANGANEIWRVGQDRAVCALGAGLSQPSAVAFGHGDRGFSRGRLFAVTFGGSVVEVPAGRVPAEDAPPPPAGAQGASVRVLFSPVSVRVRRGRATFRPRITLVDAAGRRTAVHRRIRIGRRTARTGRVVTVRVLPGARTLRVRFAVRGVARTRVIRLVR